ncbi:MAG: photosynthetic protein synthase I [Gemmatimonadaceae bacterium]|jgi:cytochrome c peroxidase|nr:photosynthetic protein synthase I [Gemmatimonadaceae bacterium]
MKNARNSSILLILCAAVLGSASLAAAKDDVPAIGPLEPLEVNTARAELGKELFFDVRLSGDAAISCATCHDPTKGWADGLPLSKAYPGSEYFRNAKTYLNSAYARYFYWDGRLSGNDGATLVRDSITETHFLNMDGRLMFLRLQQVPEYVEMFQQAFGAEPSFGRVLKAVAEFQKTVVSRNVPFDNYAAGDKDALSKDARKGLKLFRGKAGCIQCHNGSYFSDGEPHNLGVAENEDILNTPLRHITMRSMFKFMGVDGFENVKTDVGFYTVSKNDADRGSFVTPTLRELTRTAPYMHNGTLAALDDVIDFYNQGGGAGDRTDPRLKKLKLKDSERRQLRVFLEALSGDEVIIEPPAFKPYQVIENWTEVPN